MYKKFNDHLEEIHRLEFHVDELGLSVIGVSHIYDADSKFYGFISVQVGRSHHALAELGPPVETLSVDASTVEGTCLHHHWLLEDFENVVVTSAEIVEKNPLGG